MNLFFEFKRPVWRLSGSLGWMLGGVFSLMLHSAGYAGDESVVTAVASRVSDDYRRTPLPGGGFEPESYAFGEGGVWRGDAPDASIDKLKFMDVARVIALPLYAKNYVPAKDPQKTKLLIMVYWGTTAGTGGASTSVAYQNLAATQKGSLPPPKPPQGGSVSTSGSDGIDPGVEVGMLAQVGLENRVRDRADARNAAMLGYDAEGIVGTDYGRNMALTALRVRQQDLIEEIGESRYFVVLMAYDFQLMAQKKPKLLWETRFSIRQHGNDFDRQLSAMTEFASRYFGQETHGLIRKPMKTESIKLDELKILGVEPDK